MQYNLMSHQFITTYNTFLSKKLRKPNTVEVVQLKYQVPMSGAKKFEPTIFKYLVRIIDINSKNLMKIIIFNVQQIIRRLKNFENSLS